MISVGDTTCPKCGRPLKYYDHVRRIIKSKGGVAHWIRIRRLVCVNCGSFHNELPKYLIPNKHYEARIVKAFILGTISCQDVDFEDYPCDTTIARWKQEYQSSSQAML